MTTARIKRLEKRVAILRQGVIEARTQRETQVRFADYKRAKAKLERAREREAAR